MNVEWWGGEQSSPPAKYNLALRRSQAALLGWTYLPEGRALARSLFIRRARRPRPQGTELICVYLCASVVK